MREVRSFDQNPPVHPATAHPVYLIALRRLPQGSCFTLHPQLYGTPPHPANDMVMERHLIQRHLIRNEVDEPSAWYLRISNTGRCARA